MTQDSTEPVRREEPLIPPAERSDARPGRETPRPPSKPGHRSPAFRPDIEGLRGFAVFIVVAFHCGLTFVPGGFVGVDVFFVLSGYLITGLLVAEVERTSRLDLLNFYARRVRRLLPASAVTLLATLAAGSLFLAPDELTFAARAARASALYLSNVFFATNAADYFAPNVETNPILHTWSLAVEEQFYFVWPLLIMLGLQRLRSRKALSVLLFAITAVSLAACIWFTKTSATFAFYQLPARAWEFAVGGLATLLPRGRTPLAPPVWLTTGWCGLGLVAASACLIPNGAGFPGWIAVAPVLGTTLALIAGAELPGRGIGVIVDSAPLQFLGKLSYSWYLWHWPFLVTAGALWPNLATPGRVMAAACSLLAAMITHRLVENPIRFHPRLVPKPALSIGLAAVVTFASVAIATVATRFGTRLAERPDLGKISAAVHDISTLPRPRCQSLEDSRDVRSCVFGDKSSPANVVLFGDSHALQWFNPLRKMAETRGFKLTTVIRPACPAAEVVLTHLAEEVAAACSAWRSEAIRTIVSMRPSLVVVASSTSFLARPDPPSRRSGVSLDQWREGTRRTWSTLARGGVRIAALRDNPWPGFDVPSCLARSARLSWYPGGSCEMERSRVLDPAVFEAEKAAAAGLQPAVSFFDLTGQLCDTATCWAVRDGEVMYRDDNHLASRFAERLLPELERRLLPILNRAP